MEWLLEKVCEMGIESITPILTQRSEKNYFKKERFEKILIAAMLQSQQTYLPILEEPKALKDIIEREYDQKLIAYCGQEFEKFSALNAVKPRKSTLFLIGPEGDFTSDEVHLCMQNQFSAIHLGANRLRTETAGLFVCTLLMPFNEKIYTWIQLVVNCTIMRSTKNETGFACLWRWR
jgi:16S rRNA (uracil1498-N3)-methyltransferase